jgi:hypothetical protein
MLIGIFCKINNLSLSFVYRYIYFDEGNSPHLFKDRVFEKNSENGFSPKIEKFLRPNKKIGVVPVTTVFLPPQHFFFVK